METSSTFDLPFDRLAMDIVGPLSLTAQYDLLLPDHEQ